MFSTMAIAQAIREPARTHELPALIAKSRGDLGSHTFDQHLLDLVTRRQISLETATANASSPAELTRALSLEQPG
jgi:Tfp pilus assembly pilus retraction ATPase PilT